MAWGGALSGSQAYPPGMTPTGHRETGIVRPVVAGDWRDLRELRLHALKADPQAFGSTYAREAAHPKSKWVDWAAASEAGERSRTFVAFGEHRWQGMAFAELLDDGDAGLFGVWVDPRDRHMGIATALVDAVVAWARERGAAGVSLSIAEDNTAAAAMFGSNGFAVTGERGTLHSRPEVGTLAMRRPLDL